MAKTDLETLVVRLEAQMKSFDGELKRARGIADRETRAIEKRFSDTNKKLAGTFAGLGAAMTRGLGAVGIGLGANELKNYADAYTNIQNALKVTGLEGDKLNAVYDRLFASAQRNAVPIGSMASLYGKLALVSGELGVSQEQLIGFVDRVGVALKVSGTSTTEAAGALTQLSQALGGGVVRAEEFNSMMEGTPTIVQAVAKGIEEAGGSVGKLRQLVVDGKVSSKAFFDAYLIGSADLEKSAGKMDGTISQAVTRLGNAFTDAVGKINKSGGVSREVINALDDFSDEIKWIGDNIDKVAKPFNDLLKWLRDIDQAAQSAARWIGAVTGADRIGPAVKRGLGIDQERGITAPDLDLTGGIPGLARTPTKAISVEDPNYKPPKKSQADATVGVDSWARTIAQAEKRIAVQKAETAVIDQGSAARERARLVAELESAAVAANTAAKLKNTEVTPAQRIEIERLAEAQYQSAAAAERANGPMARAARSALDMNTNLQEIGVSAVDDLARSITGVASGTKTAAEAFKDMTQSILRDLTQMLIKAALWKVIMGALGGGPATYSGTGNPWASGGMSSFASGGRVRGPGTGTSDSIPAWLSDGEYVVNAQAARQNRALLDFINARGYAAGGLVTAPGGESGDVEYLM